MKLYERNLKRCVMLSLQKNDDGEGGEVLTWTDGHEFDAAFVLEAKHVKRIGERERTLGVYNVIVPVNDGGVRLSFGDRFRIAENGRVFCVTGECEAPPSSSVIMFSSVTAEAWIEDTDEEDEL